MGDFLMQPPVIIMIAFVLICIVVLVGIVALLRSSRANQQASKKAAIQAELQPPVSRSSAPAPKTISTFDMFDAAASHDDPLADLYADDDDDSVDLASLLSGIGEEKVHTIANGQVNVRLESGNTVQARELLSVLRDENDGRLMILAGETAYRTLLNDPEVKKLFTLIMKELSAVILKPDDAAPATQTPVGQPAPAATQKTETPSVTAAPAQQQTTPTPAASVSNEDTATSTRTMKEVAEPLPGDLPSFKMPDNPDNYKVGRFGSVSVKRIDKAPELNIADAIEAYLQYKIDQNPQYQRRGIHIKPALGGGVKIEADGKSYEFVDEVADADVRSFIQTAINEWQERQ
jgi:hypothetical protein